MLLFPVLTYNYAKRRPHCTPIYCRLVSYTCTCIYEHTLTCIVALLVWLSCSEFGDLVRVHWDWPSCDRIVERPVPHFSVRQGSLDYMYAAIHAVMYILCACQFLQSPSGTLRQYSNKGGWRRPLTSPKFAPSHNKRSDRGQARSRWKRQSTFEIPTILHRVCLRRRHWQTKTVVHTLRAHQRLDESVPNFVAEIRPPGWGFTWSCVGGLQSEANYKRL